MAELVLAARSSPPWSPRAASRPRPPRRSRSSARARAGGGSGGRPRRCRTAARGSRITSAPPASPECSAIQPAWRPITSTTITRLWLSAVVCSRSIASVATCTAVSNPNVMSVPPRSLSIVFGTPSTGRSCSACSLAAAPSVSSPPIAIRPSRSSERRFSRIRSGAVVARERVRARGAEDRAAARQDAARGLHRQLLEGVLERAAPAVAEADDRVSVAVDALADDRPDHGVQPGAVAAAGEHADAHDRHVSPAAAAVRMTVRAVRGRATACALRGPARARPRGLPRRRRRRRAGGPAGRAHRLHEPARARPVGRRGRRRGGGRPAGLPAGARTAPARTRCGSCASTRRRAAGEPWDPGQVQANAERASDDPSAIAYIGELGLGASAISVPVTNDAGLLQVSPLDWLTSLTRAPPGRAGRGAPERYYPTGRRTFLRLTPNDLREVELLTGRLGTLGARRVALVAGEGVYAEELASQLAERLRRAGHTLIAIDDLTDDPAAARARVAEHRGGATRTRSSTPAWATARRSACSRRSRARCRPRRCSRGAACSTGRRCASARLRRGWRRYSPLAAGRELRPLGASACSRRCGARADRRRPGPRRSTDTRPRGWCSTRCASGGSRRPAVVRAALRPRARARRRSGRYEVNRSGDVTGPPMTLYRLENGVFQPASGGRADRR